jgi:hypothetical protein
MAFYFVICFLRNNNKNITFKLFYIFFAVKWSLQYRMETHYTNNGPDADVDDNVLIAAYPSLLQYLSFFYFYV